MPNTAEKEERVLTGKEKRAIEKKRHFISQTAELLSAQPFHDVTLRTIASYTNYNSASIYTYFKDLNELLLFSIYKFSHTYIQELKKEISPHMTSLEQYRSFYAVFTRFTYRYPEMYLEYFFGTHGYRLEEIVRDYDEIFPEERIDSEADLTQELLSKGGLYGFHQSMVSHLARDGYIREEHQALLASILSHMQKSYLYDLSKFPQYTAEEAQVDFMKQFNQLILLASSGGMGSDSGRCHQQE